MSGVGTPVRIGTLHRLTRAHPYFRDWDLARMKRIETQCRVLDVPAGTRLLDHGDLAPYEYFLLDGALALQSAPRGVSAAAAAAVAGPVAAPGPVRTLRAGELDAGFPVAHLRPCQYRVTVTEPARLLRIEASCLRGATGARGQARFLVEDSTIGGSWRDHPLVLELLRRRRARELEIPPLPGIALRIRRALARDDQDMSSIATVIGADPAIAGRLIRVANSALFSGQKACDSVQGALLRLGIPRVQNVVMTIAAKGLFNTRTAHLKPRLLARWRHAIDIAALCGVLGRMTPGLDSDRTLLVGLLHEIGALPVLSLAAGYPDLALHPQLLDDILEGLVPELSAEVLGEWGFHEEFIEAAWQQTHWYRDHDGRADPADALIVAHLHALVKQRAFQRLPRIDETPAFQKLALGQLSPQLSLQVLDQARGQVQELKSLLM